MPRAKGGGLSKAARKTIMRSNHLAGTAIGLARSIWEAAELTPEQRERQYTVMMAHILREARDSDTRTQAEYLALSDAERAHIGAIYQGLFAARLQNEEYVKEAGTVSQRLRRIIDLTAPGAAGTPDSGAGSAGEAVSACDRAATACHIVTAAPDIATGKAASEAARIGVTAEDYRRASRAWWPDTDQTGRSDNGGAAGVHPAILIAPPRREGTGLRGDSGGSAQAPVGQPDPGAATSSPAPGGTGGAQDVRGGCVDRPGEVRGPDIPVGAGGSDPAQNGSAGTVVMSLDATGQYVPIDLADILYGDAPTILADATTYLDNRDMRDTMPEAEAWTKLDADNTPVVREITIDLDHRKPTTHDLSEARLATHGTLYEHLHVGPETSDRCPDWRSRCRRTPMPLRS